MLDEAERFVAAADLLLSRDEGLRRAEQILDQGADDEDEAMTAALEEEWQARKDEQQALVEVAGVAEWEAWPPEPRSTDRFPGSWLRGGELIWGRGLAC